MHLTWSRNPLKPQGAFETLTFTPEFPGSTVVPGATCQQVQPWWIKVIRRETESAS